MKEIKWKQIHFIDTEKKEIPAEEGQVNLRTEKVQSGRCHGYAVYCSVNSPVGMSHNGGVSLQPIWKDCNRFLSSVEHSPVWDRPHWGKSLSELHKKTVMFLTEEKGVYTCVFCACDTITKTFMRGKGEAGGFEFVLATNVDGMKNFAHQLSFVVMQGREPRKLFRAVTETVAKLLGNGLKMREERKFPNELEYLGWCSWDAFQIRVNHDGLLEKVAEFKHKGVPVHYAIIDDMWADVPHLEEIPKEYPKYDMILEMNKSKLVSIEGSPKRFPQGMKQTIQDIKNAGIPCVSIWFPTLGYWGGIEPGSQAEKDLQGILALNDKGHLTVIPAPEKAEKYFDVFCSKIKSWGADFVKIDYQSVLERFKNQVTFGAGAIALQDGIATAAEKYFGGTIINCMGMASETMFHRTRTAVTRCSDDFEPENRVWFAKNILQCSYNGLIQGQYYFNDWDMWWTDDEQAGKNSVCRAISGGPVYISDMLNRTKADVLRPVILSDGRLLRCDDCAAPTNDCLMENPTKSGKLFKIQNRVNKKNGVLAVYNIDEENRPVSATLSPEDCFLPTGKYAWYEYFTKTAGILAPGEKITLSLESNDVFRLYTFVPMNENGVAVMGRTDLYVGVKAATVLRGGKTIRLAEGGEISFVCEHPITVTNRAGKELPTETIGVLTKLKIPKTCKYLKFR